MANRTRPRAYRPIVLIRPHNALCGAVARQSPAWSEGAIRFGWDVDRVPWDATGRRNEMARHNWLVYRCEARGCSAELAVLTTRVRGALGIDDDATWVAR